MAAKVTIKDVAQLSGVSIGTVDRVMHDRGKVSAEKKEAVLRAAKALNYTPSQIARALVKQRSNVRIGVSFMDVTHKFWKESMDGISYAIKRLAPFGVEVVLDHCSDYTSIEQQASVQRLLDKGVDGILLTPVEESVAWIANVIPKEIPCVTVIDDIDYEYKLVHIGPDDYAIGRLIAKLALLYTKEQPQTVVIAPNAHVKGTRRRVAGYRKMLQEYDAEISVQVLEIPGTFEQDSYDKIYDGVRKIILEKPDVNAIYVTNGSTEWAAKAVKDMQLSHTVHVFGHEYTDDSIKLMEEGYITATVCQKPGEQWNMALNILNDFIMEGKQVESKNYIAECVVLTAETMPFTKLGMIYPL